MGADRRPQRTVAGTMRSRTLAAVAAASLAMLAVGNGFPISNTSVGEDGKVKRAAIPACTGPDSSMCGPQWFVHGCEIAWLQERLAGLCPEMCGECSGIVSEQPEQQPEEQPEGQPDDAQPLIYISEVHGMYQKKTEEDDNQGENDAVAAADGGAAHTTASSPNGCTDTATTYQCAKMVAKNFCDIGTFSEQCRKSCGACGKNEPQSAALVFASVVPIRTTASSAATAKDTTETTAVASTTQANQQGSTTQAWGINQVTDLNANLTHIGDADGIYTTWCNCGNDLCPCGDRPGGSSSDSDSSNGSEISTLFESSAGKNQAFTSKQVGFMLGTGIAAGMVIVVLIVAVVRRYTRADAQGSAGEDGYGLPQNDDERLGLMNSVARTGAGSSKRKSSKVIYTFEHPSAASDDADDFHSAKSDPHDSEESNTEDEMKSWSSSYQPTENMLGRLGITSPKSDWRITHIDGSHGESEAFWFQ